MISLAMDTAGSACAACLYDSSNQKVLAEMSEEIGRGHAERLMGLVSDVMNRAKICYNDIGRIITTVGPGSFTGIRVGVATARGFGVGLGIPVVGVTNLEAMIAEAVETLGDKDAGNIGAVMEAGRGQLYCQFTFATPLSERDTPFMASVDAVAECLNSSQSGVTLCGNAAGSLSAMLANKPAITENLESPRTSVIAHIRAAKTCSHQRTEPLYLPSPAAKRQTRFLFHRSS